MPRPKKWRRVCCLPGVNRFGPLDFSVDKDHFVLLSVDEYETIRLIDFEGLTQEECSNQMHVARTTVQGIYQAARKKIAEALVNGKILRIEGGDYKICDGEEDYYRGRCCHRNRCSKAKLEHNSKKEIL